MTAFASLRMTALARIAVLQILGVRSCEAKIN
jgi:hypothetical protein